MIKHTAFPVCLLCGLLLTGTVLQAAMADELADLKAQLDLLRQRVAVLEQQEADQEQTLQTAGTETIDTDRLLKAGSTRGSWTIPGTETSMRISGFIRAHMIYDIGPRPTSSGGDVASTRRAILEGEPEYENRGDVRIAGRDARFTIETSTPSDYGKILTYIQGDFKGDPDNKGSRATTNRTAFTLRHAYAEVGNWLMGQTYSTYLDNTVFGDKVDPTGPQGRSMVRQGQLRYTHHLDNEREIAVGIENPRADFIDADDDNLHDGYPNLAMHYRHETNDWMYQLGAMVRRMGIKQVMPIPADDEVFGWGFNTSGMYLFPAGRDRITWLINFGDGVGRYLESGSDQGASITPDGKLDTQFGYGGFVTFKHWWTDTLSSNVDLGMGFFDLNPDEDPEANRKLHSSHFNLIWTPIRQLELGLEYVWGHRVVKDGRSGNINRIMMNSIFNF